MIRKDIQIYRCLAVVSVIIYHFNTEILPYGYLGVDLFFVISGYLITKQILNLRLENKFKLSNFYFRRFKRIFPSLISSSIFTLILGFYNLSLEHFYELLRGIKYSLLFIGNVFFSQTIDYFTIDAKRNLIINLWSLSVEEQFYLVFPLIILIGTKLKKIKFSSYVIVCFLFSLIGLSEFFFIKLSISKVFFTFENYLFYSPFARSFQFLIGSLGATFDSNQFKKLKNLNKFFIILLLISFYFSINSLNQIVVTTLSLFLVSNELNIKENRINTLLIHIGNISFSLYLFHQPILAGIRNHIYYSFYNSSNYYSLDNIIFVFFTLIAIYFISILNFYFVEQTYRKENDFSFMNFKFVVIGFFVLLGLVQFPNILGNFKNQTSFITVPNKSVTNSWSTKNGTNYLINKDNQTCIDQDSLENACSFGIGDRKLYILGDSSTSSLVSGLLDDSVLQKFTVIEYTKSGCYPVINICEFIPGYTFYNDVFSINNSTIIVGGVYDNGFNYIPEEDLKKTINQLQGKNNKVIVLGYIPSPKVDEVMYFNKSSILIKSLNEEHYFEELERNNEFNNIIEEFNLPKKENFKYLEIFKSFCNNKECKYFNNTSHFFIDGVHLSYFGAETIFRKSGLKNYLMEID